MDGLRLPRCTATIPGRIITPTGYGVHFFDCTKPEDHVGPHAAIGYPYTDPIQWATHPDGTQHPVVR